MKQSACPFCGYVMDAATAVYDKGARPQPNDLGICLSCAKVLLFADDLTHRAPKPGELEAMFAEDMWLAKRVYAAQRTIRALDRVAGKPDVRRNRDAH